MTKFYNFINEMARISFIKMSAEEIAQNVMENFSGDKDKAVNYLKNYAKNAAKNKPEMQQKIYQSINLILNRKTYKTSGEKESFGTSAREKASQFFNNYTQKDGYAIIVREIDNAKSGHEELFWIEVLNHWNTMWEKHNNKKSEKEKAKEKAKNVFNSMNKPDGFKFIQNNINAATETIKHIFWLDVMVEWRLLWIQKENDDFKKQQKEKQSQKDFYKTWSSTTFDKVKGVKFCLTGKGPYPREHIEENIKEAGGFIYSIKYADVLVCSNPDSTSAKMLYAKKEGLKIITYNDLYKIINQNPFGDKKTAEEKASTGTWTIDEVLSKVRNFLEIDKINEYIEEVYTHHMNVINKRLNYFMKNNDSNMYNFWNKVKEIYQLKFNEAKTYFENFKRDRERRRQEQQYRTSTFSSDRNERVKKLILKGVTPIDKDKFSYASLARKVHPDFHMNHPENRENATEMMKLVNANKGNLMVLRQYARDWGLLTEMFKQKRYDVYQFLCEWLNNN